MAVFAAGNRPLAVEGEDNSSEVQDIGVSPTAEGGLATAV
jgi:hypothetical protein